MADPVLGWDDAVEPEILETCTWLVMDAGKVDTAAMSDRFANHRFDGQRCGDTDMRNFGQVNHQ